MRKTKSIVRTSGIQVVALVVTFLVGTPTQAQSGRTLKFLAKQCNEDAIELYLDARPFQDFVGPEFSLVLEEGKARVLIVVQDCSQYWVDGEDLGPTQDVHVWVSIDGPDEIRHVVGAQQTLPTRTWFTVFTGTSNPRAREAKMISGTVVRPIDSVSMDPPGMQRSGRASLVRNLEYSWDVLSAATPAVRLVGVNHDVYTRDSTGNVVLNRVQALMCVSAGASQGTLKIVGESDLLSLIPPGTYTVSVRTFFPMWGRTTLGLSASH